MATVRPLAIVYHIRQACGGRDGIQYKRVYNSYVQHTRPKPSYKRIINAVRRRTQNTIDCLQLPVSISRVRRVYGKSQIEVNLSNGEAWLYRIKK